METLAISTCSLGLDGEEEALVALTEVGEDVILSNVGSRFGSRRGDPMIVEKRGLKRVL